ncbi:MAG: response regulator [Candidatus Woesearchaeota archaeon]
MKVMIVDDSMFMRNVVKNTLTPLQVEIVAECGDGQQAIDKYQELKPDLTFMDIMMPNVSGIDALRKIKELDPNAKIVMCTSVGQDKIMQEAVSLGALDFILKPFKPEDIQKVVQKAGG